MAGAVLRAEREQGVTVLLAEQNLRFAAERRGSCGGDRDGRIVWSGTMATLTADADLRGRFLGV